MISGPQRREFLFTLVRITSFRTLHYMLMFSIFDAILYGRGFRLEFFSPLVVGLGTALIERIAVPFSSAREPFPEHLEVHPRRRAWTWSFAIILSIAIFFSAQEAIGLGQRGIGNGVRENIVFSLLSSIVLAIMLFGLLFRVRLDAHGLSIRRFVENEFVPWDQVIDCQRSSLKDTFFSRLWGSTNRNWILRHRSGQKVRETTIPESYSNSRTLVKVVEKRIREQKSNVSA